MKVMSTMTRKMSHSWNLQALNNQNIMKKSILGDYFVTKFVDFIDGSQIFLTFLIEEKPEKEVDSVNRTAAA